MRSGTDGARKIRILYFVPQLTIGGTERHVVELVRRLDARRFETRVWCPGGWGPLGDELRSIGARFVSLPWPALRAPVALASAARALRAMNLDIFHSFWYGAHVADALVARLAGIRTYVGARRNVRHWDPSGRVRTAERIRNILTTLVVANSKAAAACCATIEGVPPDRIKIIYTGVDTVSPAAQSSASLRQRYAIPHDALLVGNVANLKPVKGQTYLLEALRLLGGWGIPARLLIAGEGEERARLEGLIREHGLAGRVVLLGAWPHPETLYRALDLYAHPSLAEGLPNAVLEAMAHGVPVVATSAGGTAELIVDGVTGLVVPPREGRVLAEAMRTLLVDAERRRRMGEAGRVRVGNEFSVSRMIQEYEAVYEAVAQRQGVPDRASGVA